MYVFSQDIDGQASRKVSLQRYREKRKDRYLQCWTAICLDINL